MIGAVSRPASYASRRTPILLGDLIDRAGGVNRQASGTVRIFRDGRLEQEFYFDQSRRIVEVPPGSVIVVDSSTSRPHEGLEAGRDYCDIACLNLVERPVVHRMLPDEATLAQLLESLGQPGTVAASVRVLRKSRMEMGISSQLNSGDVVVFDPSAVDQAALSAALDRSPVEDVPLIDEAPASAAAGIDGAAGERSPADSGRLRVTTVAAELSDSTPESPAPRHATVEIIPMLPAGEPVPAPPMDPTDNERPDRKDQFLAQSVGAAFPTVNEAGASTPASPYPHKPEIGTTEAQPAPIPPLETKTEQNPERSFVTDDRLDPIGQTRGTHPAQRTSGSGTMTTAITAGLCAFIALTLLSIWLRRNREPRNVPMASRPQAPIDAAPPDAPESLLLDEMINDTLPLIEEDPAFPAQMLFHGRTLGFRYLLLSGPHGLHGPHFRAGQVNPRLRDHVGSGSAQTVLRSGRPGWMDRPPIETGDEPQADGNAETSDVVQDEPADRAAGRGRHHPSPLERALLARRGRNRT